MSCFAFTRYTLKLKTAQADLLPPGLGDPAGPPAEAMRVVSGGPFFRNS